MRVYFSVYGVGSGHSIRSYRLARKFYELGSELYLSTFGDGVRVYKDLSRRRIFKKVSISKNLEYRWVAEGLTWSGTLAYSAININTLYSHLVDEYKNIRSLSPDLVISDSRLSSIFVAHRLGIKVVSITNQLNIKLPKGHDRSLSIFMNRIWELSDLILIPDLPPTYTITYSNIVPYLSYYDRGKVLFTGLLIDSTSLKRFSNFKNGRNIDIFFMVSAPTRDRLNFLKSIYLSLNDSKVRKSLLKYNVLILEGAAYKKGYKHRLNDHIEIIGWTDDPLSILSNSRIAILRGGQTSILESILVETPMIIIPAENQTEQMENARRVEELGLGLYLRYKLFLKDPNILVKYIRELEADYNYYRDNIRNVKNVLVKISNLDKVVDYIIRMV